MTTKTILVTGAASGIGLACTRDLLAEGNRVTALDLDMDSLKRAHPNSPAELVLFVCDVSIEESCTAAVAATADRFGLEPHLAFLCGYDSGHGAKPGRGMVDGFCAATGLPADAVAVVGDSSHDMHMAAAAGAGLRVAVLTGAGSADTLRPLSHLLLPSIATLEQALFA